jgi:eukaryotic-like serine/threonine-protein kinase
MVDDTPERIGDYEVLRVLGAGGMGRVYQVRNVVTDRIEAMKVLLPDLRGQEEVAARFLREIKVLAALKHPNIATLHTALTIDNVLVMIMEYVDGWSLASRLSAGPIPIPDALTYVDQILEALSYAHQQHVIHRDIKPANMMLTPDGTVKLMDFGIAHTEGEPTALTAPGSTLGSINYMSPEQVKGERTDERSDLYSLGISLYEMVTGQKPFHGDSSFSLMAAHLDQVPTPPIELRPGLSDGLNQMILTAIAKSPDQRFQSADAFRNAVRTVLRSFQGSETVIQGSQNTVFARPSPPPSPVRTATAPATTAALTPPSARPPVRPPAVTVAAAPVPAKPVSGRGLYVSLGAIIVLVALVAAGFYLPGRGKVSAAGDVKDAVHQPRETAPQLPPAQPPPTSAVEKQAVEAVPAPEPTKRTAPKQMAARDASAGPTAADNARAAAEAAARAKEQALEQVEQEVDQLFSRSAAVNSSLERLQHEQAAAGYGLRGDISSRMASMKVNLARAQDAIARKDEVRAKKYADVAAADVEALEKFLGR